MLRQLVRRRREAVEIRSPRPPPFASKVRVKPVDLGEIDLGRFREQAAVARRGVELVEKRKNLALAGAFEICSMQQDARHAAATER